ncbi:MAG: hypothetical protein ACK42Z_01755 [Candidatus Kapaibacteriota bacterium]
MKKLLVLLLLSCFTLNLTYAKLQYFDNDTSASNPQSDFIKRFNLRDRLDRHPYLSLYSGFNRSEYSRVSSSNEFKTQNFAIFCLGFTKIRSEEKAHEDGIFKITRSGLFIGNYSSKWFSSEKGNLDASMWRFGFNLSDDGWGYKLGPNNYLFFVFGNSLNWSKINVDGLSGLQQPDSSLLGIFSDQFRFGNTFHSGVSFVLFNYLAFDFRFERALIYPAHKFWYWLGSYFIEGVSHFLLDEFIEEVFKSSPKAAPIVNALLKSSLSYGIYELRKTKMNWPFNTEAPLLNNNFKFGLSFIF